MNKPSQSSISRMGMRPLILAVLLTSLIATSTLAVLDVNRPFMLGLLAVLLVSTVFTWIGMTGIGSWSALLASLVVLSILFFQNNGLRDTATLGLIVVLIAAGLLAGKPGTLLIGCLIIIEIGIYGAL